MALKVGTHSGTFHADDVLAFGLIRVFVDPEAEVIRSRDLERLKSCDVVVDVGGIYDPAQRRFDHHQGSYTGHRSSAGMVLDWLESTDRVSADLAGMLRARAIDYVDAVDTGREAPRPDVPCFARIIDAIGQGCDTPDAQQAAFLEAAHIGIRLIEGLRRGWEEEAAARQIVLGAMAEAVAAGRSVIYLERYVPWKQIYFDHGGATHPTDYVLYPSEGETWKLLAIPPSFERFEQKRPLPASWAGKLGEELEEATGIPGALFCHKNRFVAVFRTREIALQAIERFGLGAPVSAGCAPSR